MYLNNVVIGGNLTRKPELKYTQSGTAKAKFTVAVNRKYRDASNQVQEDVQFIPVVVWGTQAENCEQYLAKGQEVAVVGRLAIDKFDGKDGEKVTYPYVVAQNVQFGKKANGNGKYNQNNEPEEDDDEQPIPF